MRIALAQMSPFDGDIAGIAAAIGRALTAARERDVDLVMFPLPTVTSTLTGNSAQASAFLDECARAIVEMAEWRRDFTAIIGCPIPGGSPVHVPRNAAMICTGGKIAQCHDLPARILVHGARVGIVLGEARQPQGEWPSPSNDISNAFAPLAAQGVDLLVILGMGGLWERDAAAPRHPASALAKRYAAPVLCCVQADARGEAAINSHCAFDKHGEPIPMTVVADGSLLLIELPDVGFATGDRPTTCGGVNWGPASNAHGQR